jgi:membrane protease YdiL (CAAX protease family)
MDTSPSIDTAAAPDAPSTITWEDDETTATLFLRALCTLVAGGFLLYAQHRAPVAAGAEWGRFVSLSFFANLLIPLGIVWMFFGQGLARLDWLRDQKYNAWNYGWDWRAWRRHFAIAGALCALMLPALWIFSGDAQAQSYYRSYLPMPGNASDWILLLATLTFYMFCWEWFHRGFLLFGMAQGFGPVVAIVLQALLFGAAHMGKPPLEMYSSFAGGLILGVIAWREKSFVPAFLAHALIHLVWAVLVLVR